VREPVATLRGLSATIPKPRPRTLPAPLQPLGPPEPRPRSLEGEPPASTRGPSTPPPPIGPSVAAGSLEAELPRSNVDPFAALFSAPQLREPSPYPRIVLAPRPRHARYEYMELLKRLLREIYRVTARLPGTILHAGRRLTEYQLATLRGGPGVYVVDLDGVAESEASEAALRRLAAGLEDRLRELYAQPPGFIVLYGSGERLLRLRRLWGPGLRFLGATLPLPLEARIPEDDAVFTLLEAAYSLPDGSLSRLGSLDEAAVWAEEALHRCLRAAAADPLLGRLTRLAGDEEEARPDEAPIHYALKAVAVAYLLESGFRETRIETETALGGNIVVDVVARGRGWGGASIAIEAETLYGSMNPAARLNWIASTRLMVADQVWMVLQPHTAFIYLPHVETVVRRHGGRLEIYIVDPSTCLLKPYTEYRSRLLDALARLEG